MSLPGLLTPAQAGPLLGYSARTVQRLIADGWFPAGCVVMVGKTRARLSLQRLLDARLVPAAAVDQVATAAPAAGGAQ